MYTSRSVKANISKNKTEQRQIFEHKNGTICHFTSLQHHLYRLPRRGWSRFCSAAALHKIHTYIHAYIFVY